MPSNTFCFKQFSIEQDHCAMKVGTDGVLLGAWANIEHLPETEPGKPYAVLDIGAGTGIISLMLCQRLSEANINCQIEAIEIDEEAANQASENFRNSPWGEKITIHPDSLEVFQQKVESSDNKKYSLIASNPPFYNATLKPEDKGRATARHKDSLPIADIAEFASQHLTQEGRLALIYPTDYDSEVMTAMVLNHLHPIRICDVLTKVGKACKRRMAEFSLTARPVIREQLAIRNAEGKYTEEYLRLTDAFYLHLTD